MPIVGDQDTYRFEMEFLQDRKFNPSQFVIKEIARGQGMISRTRVQVKIEFLRLGKHYFLASVIRREQRKQRREKKRLEKKKEGITSKTPRNFRFERRKRYARNLCSLFPSRISFARVPRADQALSKSRLTSRVSNDHQHFACFVSKQTSKNVFRAREKEEEVSRSSANEPSFDPLWPPFLSARIRLYFLSAPFSPKFLSHTGAIFAPNFVAPISRAITIA